MECLDICGRSKEQIRRHQSGRFRSRHNPPFFGQSQWDVGRFPPRCRQAASAGVVSWSENPLIISLLLVWTLNGMVAPSPIPRCAGRRDLRISIVPSG